MKVILLQDVSKIGRRFEVVEVPRGHALNKLIPQKLAEEATAHNLKRIEARTAKTNAEREAAGTAFAAALATLQDKTISIEAEANEQGHLFQALKADRIVAALTAEGVTLTEPQIHIAVPIKEVGSHTIRVHEGDASGTFEITVVAKE